MLSSEQIKNITYVYSKLLESELKGWSTIDDYLELTEWLDNDQLYRECEVLYSVHKTKKMGYPYLHAEGTVCFVVGILEAVEAILGLYMETGSMHIRNRYILCNYLALCQDGQICELPDFSAT